MNCTVKVGMHSTVEQNVFDFITTNKLFSSKDKVVIAVSGGADSVCLFRILCALESRGFQRGNFFVVHVNHNLRGKFSDADQEFVESLAKEYSLRYKSISVDVVGYAKNEKLSIETAARNLRQAHIATAAQEFGASLIATAHHSDDNAETIIHRLMRGCGYKGLAGIWPKKHFSQYDVTYIRPLLAIRRKDIIEHLSGLKQSWRQDHSNDQLIYTRNKIRHKLLPQLNSDCDCDIAAKLYRLSVSARKLQNRIAIELERVSGLIDFGHETATILRREFNALSPACKVAVITEILLELGLSSLRLDSTHIENILKLAATDTGSSNLQLPQNFEVLNEYGKLIFYLKRERKAIEDTTLVVPGITKFGNSRFETRIFEFEPESFEIYKRNNDCNIEWFDADKVSSSLILRQRKHGDFFVPFGRREKQRVGKFLTSAKVSRIHRDDVVVIEDETKIIWLSPIRASAQTKVTNKTKQVLEVKRIYTSI